MIIRFTALDARGQQVTGVNPLGACEPATLVWFVLSDDSTPPQVDITSAAATVASAIAPTGSLVLRPARYERLTLRAENGCGVSTQTFDLETRAPVLRLASKTLSVLRGRQASMPFSFSCPVEADTAVSFVSSDPRVTVTSSVVVPAGAVDGHATVAGVAHGPAEQATAIVTLTAPGYASQEAEIWVEEPLGEWNVVKDPAAPADDLALPMLAVHAQMWVRAPVLRQTAPFPTGSITKSLRVHPLAGRARDTRSEGLVRAC